MKNLKLVILGIIALAQVSLVSAMNPSDRNKFFIQKELGLNNEYKEEIKKVFISDLAGLINDYVDAEKEILETKRLLDAICKRNHQEIMAAIYSGANTGIAWDRYPDKMISIANCYIKYEESKKQEEEAELKIQKAEEALAQMAAQPAQEDNWEEEHQEEATEDWGELEQED